ncbi:replication initiation protein [Paracoccus hibiscisoli]|jgi:plasmid replication initiation protein|uniref:Replication initiation protein n=2 Tax=Paracoccus hibiscisoli TaxID=2023261 RepID=A0A4V5MRM2_9RHOB|nr:replication initiation protein [Paracoccus hibiscisoli]
MARPRKETSVLNLPAGGNVTMHNTLVSASHGLNLGEKRLVAMAVAKLSPKAAALPGKPIKISAVDFAEQYGVDTDTAYEQLRDAQENLFQRYITHIEHFGPNGQRVMVSKMRWVSSIHYEKGAGEVSLAFAPEIAQFLVQLKKHFTSYQLSKAAALRSTYSWRLFENLERFRETGVWEVDMDRFHTIMETPKSYRRNFNDARRFVIDPAVLELAAKTNITAEVEPIRRGRKIARLRFTFENASQMNLPL